MLDGSLKEKKIRDVKEEKGRRKVCLIIKIQTERQRGNNELTAVKSQSFFKGISVRINKTSNSRRSSEALIYCSLLLTLLKPQLQTLNPACLFKNLF